MAKLTNVAVLDMVNGEITKIAYDGAEYAKVTEYAKLIAPADARFDK